MSTKPTNRLGISRKGSEMVPWCHRLLFASRSSENCRQHILQGDRRIAISLPLSHHSPSSSVYTEVRKDASMLNIWVTRMWEPISQYLPRTPNAVMKIGISVLFLCECVTLNELGCTTFRRKPSFKGTARNSGTSDRRHLQLQLTGSGPQMVINYNCFLFGALSVSCSGLHHLRIKPNSASLMRYHYLRIKASKGQHVITMYSDHGVWAQVLECSQNLQGWWPCGPNLNSELLPNMK